MRVALFGGSFDPIHRGHLRVAAAAANAFSLDRVLFAPVGRQPLKSSASAASFQDRVAMVALALSQPLADQGVAITPDPRFALSTLDAPRTDGAPNYTVDTLAALALEFSTAQLFMIAGADSFLTLRNWRSPAELLALAQWIVVSRPDFTLTPEFLDRPEFALTPAQRARIHLLPGVHEDISATGLRALLHDAAVDSSNQSLNQWLPPAVADYIREHHLYQ